MGAADVAHGAALASTLRAAVALARDQRDAGLAALHQALRHAEAAEAGTLTTALRRRLGALRGGLEGAAMVTAADDWLRGQGVVAPAAFAAMLVPLVPRVP